MVPSGPDRGSEWRPSHHETTRSEVIPRRNVQSPETAGSTTSMASWLCGSFESALVVWLVARFLGIFVHHGRSARLVDVVAFGALFTWSWLELFDGAAYVRRLLGLVVLLAVVAARVR